MAVNCGKWGLFTSYISRLTFAKCSGSGGSLTFWFRVYVWETFTLQSEGLLAAACAVAWRWRQWQQRHDSDPQTLRPAELFQFGGNKKTRRWKSTLNTLNSSGGSGSTRSARLELELKLEFELEFDFNDNALNHYFLYTFFSLVSRFCLTLFLSACGVVVASAAAAVASTVTLGFNLVYCAFVLRCLVKVSLSTHFVIVCIFFTRTFSQLQVVDVVFGRRTQRAAMFFCLRCHPKLIVWSHHMIRLTLKWICIYLHTYM